MVAAAAAAQQPIRFIDRVKVFLLEHYFNRVFKESYTHSMMCAVRIFLRAHTNYFTLHIPTTYIYETKQNTPHVRMKEYIM